MMYGSISLNYSTNYLEPGYNCVGEGDRTGWIPGLCAWGRDKNSFVAGFGQREYGMGEACVRDQTVRVGDQTVRVGDGW